MKKYVICLLSSAALAGLVAGAAKADPIYIGAQEAGVNGGAITTVASNVSGALLAGPFSYGTFSNNSVTGADTDELGGLPSLLDSGSLNTSTTTAGTINIFVTGQNLSGAGIFFDSSFTSNGMPRGWTVTETTYISATTALYGGTELSTHTFTCTSGSFCGAQSFDAPEASAGHAGIFSATDEFTITAISGGSANSTIDFSAGVPEASTWAMLMLGFAMVGFAGYRRKGGSAFRIA